MTDRHPHECARLGAELRRASLADSPLQRIQALDDLIERAQSYRARIYGQWKTAEAGPMAPLCPTAADWAARQGLPPGLRYGGRVVTPRQAQALAALPGTYRDVADALCVGDNTARAMLARLVKGRLAEKTGEVVKTRGRPCPIWAPVPGAV